jgi:hypothetical protein
MGIDVWSSWYIFNIRKKWVRWVSGDLRFCRILLCGAVQGVKVAME